MKRLVIKVSGSTGEPQEITIHPGSTTRDVLDSLGLSRNLLLTNDPAAGAPFGIDEPIYDKVVEGAKLYAVPPMEVGSK